MFTYNHGEKVSKYFRKSKHIKHSDDYKYYVYPANTELCGKKFMHTIIIQAISENQKISNVIRAYKLCLFLSDIPSICYIALHIYNTKHNNLSDPDINNLINENINALNSLNIFEEILSSNLLELSNKEVRILAYNYNKKLESKKAKLMQ